MIESIKQVLIEFYPQLDTASEDLRLIRGWKFQRTQHHYIVRRCRGALACENRADFDEPVSWLQHGLFTLYHQFHELRRFVRAGLAFRVLQQPFDNDAGIYDDGHGLPIVREARI